MKEYRKRFIQMSMLLIGAVLLAVLSILFFFVRADHYSQLKWAMREMLEPLSRQDPSELPEDAEKSRFVTVFVGEEGVGELSVFDLSADYNEDTLDNVVNNILQSSESFGQIKQYGVIYYRRELGSGYKIAMVDAGYITDGMKEFFVFTAAAWMISMLLFYGISRIFAKCALYPLEQARIRETQFVADVSHDLKTPLSIIMANLSILLKHQERSVSDCKNWIIGSQEAANSMKSLLNQMLELYAEDTVNERIPLGFCDLSETVRKAVLQMEAVAWDYGVQLTLRGRKSIGMIGNQDALLRVIMILIDNALKYEPPGGNVIVRTYADKRCASVSIHNHTVIASDDLPYIFDRYYRAEKTNISSGHGLGLPIAKRLARKMGGSLECRSTSSDGTFFVASFKASNKAES